MSSGSSRATSTASAPCPARPGAAGLLPQRGPGAGPAGEQHGVQPGDVDAELERVRRRRPRAAGRPAGRPRAPAAPRAGSPPGRRPPGRRSSGSTSASSRRAVDDDRLGRAPGPHEGHRPDPVGDQVGEQVGDLGGRRPAYRRLVLAGELGQRRLPEREQQLAPRRPVVGHRRRPRARPAGRRTPPARTRSRTRARTPGRSRSARRPAAAAAAPPRRASRTPRGSGGTRRRRRTARPRRNRAHRGCPGRIDRCSMSGLVSTYDACWRTQSRDSPGVSPS